MIFHVLEFCRLFYQSTSVPIHYCTQGSRQTVSFPAEFGEEDLFQGRLFGFEQFTKSPDYFISESFGCYGFIRLREEGNILIVGPIFSTPYSDFTRRNYMKEWAIPLEYTEEVTQMLMALPVLSFQRFLTMLAYLELCLNDREIDIDTHFAFQGEDRSQEREEEHSRNVIESKESQAIHNTWHFEQEMLQYIQDGNEEALEKLLKDSASLSEGQVADNALRQVKNIFISTATLACRSAILGGMDMEQAYQLSDVYIRDCERAVSIDYIQQLQGKLLFDFTRRVAHNRIPAGMSREVFDCIQFISRNVNAPIQIADVAEHIGRSRSWLTSRFKRELGMDPSTAIMQYKLKAARTLLKHSDKTLSEISTYLCFSSQSYFQNVFKKQFGQTPKQYRDQNRTVR